MLDEWEANACRAMPIHALIGVAINEAVRLSVDNDSRPVVFDEKLHPRLQ
jgi:hypothetical protein